MRAFALVLFIVAVVTGCATIVDGKNQQVTFQSTPAGATVLINGAPIGVTPISTMIEKKSGQTLVIRKDGYKDFSTSMTTTTSGWFWGNIVIGGFFGSTTDAATGAMHQYAPNQFLVTLEPNDSSGVTAKTGKSKADKVREFVLISYTPLSADIKAGSGAYLDTLLNALEISKDGHGVAIGKIQALHQAFTDISQFADQVIAAFVKQ